MYVHYIVKHVQTIVDITVDHVQHHVHHYAAINVILTVPKIVLIDAQVHVLIIVRQHAEDVQIYVHPASVCVWGNVR